MFFTYRALNQNKIVTGKVEAQNEADAVVYLRSKGYFPIQVKAVSEGISILSQ